MVYQRFQDGREDFLIPLQADEKTIRSFACDNGSSCTKTIRASVSINHLITFILKLDINHIPVETLQSNTMSFSSVKHSIKHWMKSGCFSRAPRHGFPSGRNSWSSAWVKLVKLSLSSGRMLSCPHRPFDLFVSNFASFLAKTLMWKF